MGKAVTEVVGVDQASGIYMHLRLWEVKLVCGSQVYYNLRKHWPIPGPHNIIKLKKKKPGRGLLGRVSCWNKMLKPSILLFPHL